MAAEKSAEAFRTISEVADELQVPQHVLRFWEGRFPQIKPMKRAGGRRYYRPADVALLVQIRDMLYKQGLTIKDVQSALKDGSIAAPAGDHATPSDDLGLAQDLLFDDAALNTPHEPEQSELPPVPLFQHVELVPPVIKPSSPLPPYPQPLPLIEPTIPGLVPDAPHPSRVTPEAREQLIDILDELEQLRFLLLVKN